MTTQTEFVPLPANIPRLSKREIQLLRLAAIGSADKEIAREINVSVATIRTYWDRVKVKLGARNRTHAVVVAIVAGFLVVVRP
jgi:DNA-binding NarL/FixJ family response regulator